ncbi:RNA-directed DNA polymerase, eukaryota, partial [Tanacetum coccineum]
VGADKRLGSESISSEEVPVLAAAIDFATRGLGVKDVHHVRAIAVNVRASYPEMRKLFEDAAKLFSSIGKNGLADERQRIIEHVPFIFFAHMLYISFHLQAPGDDKHIKPALRRSSSTSDLQTSRLRPETGFSINFIRGSPVLAAATDFATRGLGVKDVHHVRAIAVNVRASYPEMRKLFEDAAKLFSSIGKKGLADERQRIIEQLETIKHVYAPQSGSSKRILWNYLDSLITNWNGESLIMGDFNEVRTSEERWGSCFNVQGAASFNSFISNVGLLDISWKDHRPILLKEIISDYGPTPFRFYHSWLELPGFDDMISKRKSNGAIEGDDNSIPFIFIINKKRINLSVKGIMVDGDWIVDPSLVKQEFRCHFAERFLDPGPCRGNLDFLFPNRLNDEQVLEMEAPVSNDEIRTAVWGCGVDKSPGPDGFTFDFFRSSGTYLFLRFILDLISDVQSAFLPNRQILDGPFIINEILARCKAKKQQAMIFKVDFAKGWVISAIMELTVNIFTAYNSTWLSALIKGNKFLKSKQRYHGHCKIRLWAWKILRLLVADKMLISITSSFRRFVRGGVESFQLDHLKVLLELVILSNMEDRWDKAYSLVKSVPIKVNVFAWKLFLDRLPTRLNLARRNVYVPSLDCPLCDQGEEDTSHLFFGCSAAKRR